MKSERLKLMMQGGESLHLTGKVRQQLEFYSLCVERRRALHKPMDALQHLLAYASSIFAAAIVRPVKRV